MSVAMKSYVLGEIPSLKDRITIVRQLWELTGDVLVCDFLLVIDIHVSA
jgi:hypothetical protein